jgi:hypothetical protein
VIDGPVYKTLQLLQFAYSDNDRISIACTDLNEINVR